MSQELAVNAETGFIESTSATLRTFSSDKKQQLLDTTALMFKETGKWPDLGSLCDSIGICTRTLERHLKSDPKFADAWREVTLRGKYKLESAMFDLSTKNPMYMFGWLRKHFPEEYNPDHKISVEHNINVLSSLIEKAKPIAQSIETDAL